MYTNKCIHTERKRAREREGDGKRARQGEKERDRRGERKSCYRVRGEK
jgi:hypothetical protein